MDGFEQNDKNLKLDLLKTQENDLIKARSQDVLLQFCLTRVMAHYFESL